MPIENSCLNTILQCKDVDKRLILKQLLSEFLGVLLLVLLAVGSHLAVADAHGESSVHVPLAVGLAVTALILCFHHVSGGHINPAVTCAVFSLGKISLLRSILYILAQCLGGICGAALLQAMLPISPGAHRLNPGIHPIQGFGIEFFITFVLVLTIVAAIDPNRTDISSTSMPLAVGLAVLANCLFAGHWTGASMNPAVSFGLSVISNTWIDHWVYWLGPCVGGISAATLYWAALQAEEPPRKAIQIPANETLLSDYKLKEAAGQSGEA